MKDHFNKFRNITKYFYALSRNIKQFLIAGGKVYGEIAFCGFPGRMFDPLVQIHHFEDKDTANAPLFGSGPII